MTTHGFAAVTLILGALVVGALSGSAAADDIGPLGPPGAAATAFPKPSRQVAPIVSERWSTEAARDRDGEADQVLSFLEVAPGMTVADIGAGDGYYTVRLARRVGLAGHVIAEDVTPAYLEELRQRLDREHLTNVMLDLGEPHDPRLPARTIDLALLVHMYHEVQQPYGLLYNLQAALRPGARVAVIDLDQATERHGTPRKQLLCEFKALGYRETHWGWLRAKREYLAVFEPPATPPAPEAIRPCK